MLISNEPLEIIRQNECDDTLTGSRFRRVFQELDRLQKREHQIAEALAELRAELNGEVAYCADDDSGYDEGVQFAITKLDEMRVKLGLETQ